MAEQLPLSCNLDCSKGQLEPKGRIQRLNHCFFICRKTLGPEFEDCRDSTLVFRQGNPLLVGDLQLVNAAQTSATLILGDQSRYDVPG